MLDAYPTLTTGVMHAPEVWGELGEDEYTSHEFILTQNPENGKIFGFWALTAVGMYQHFPVYFTSVEHFEDYLAEEGFTNIVTGEVEA